MNDTILFAVSYLVIGAVVGVLASVVWIFLYLNDFFRRDKDDRP